MANKKKSTKKDKNVTEKKKKNIVVAKNKTVKNKTKTTNKPKMKKSKHIILILLLMIMIGIGTIGLAFSIYIISSAPEFKVSELYKSSSSIIYDKNNNVIAELGIEKRDNVTYDELPEVLVDAIVATEDSKFFQHSGIDLLRFMKASAGQLMGHSDAGGASTLTMQIVKNTYNGTVSHGIKGIIRKFTDIYMSVFKVEKTYTKQQIMEFYVNQPYLGSESYGVEQASQTYFGKSVGDLNLSEAATIAGLFQAPGAYDPNIFPEKAQARRNLVLGLMIRHGYITKEEADAAKAIDVKDLLVKRKSSLFKYQDFVDTVVTEVQNKTKLNPYVTSMSIYSTLDPKKQDVINQLYDGTIYKWANKYVQCGIAVTSIEDGSLVAVGARRNRTGARQLNYATSINRQPGSTAKPIFDYGPAIEYSGWGTGTTVVDDVYSYTGGGNVHNWDNGYHGIMTTKKALAESWNIPALQAFQATTQDEKYEFITNLGIKPELHNGKILESSSLGAFNGVSPLELSAAYGAFSRGGYYIEPYSFTKIVYNDTKETYTYTPNKTRAMSKETAFMINMILKYAVTSGHINVGSVPGTDLASKTGTSSVPSNLNLGRNAIGDIWQVSYSPDYAIAFWYGYDQNTKEHHLTTNEGWVARKYISKALTTRIMKKNSRWSQPKGVIKVDVELETNPVKLASPYTPDNLRSTEYFKKGTEPTEVSTRFNQLDNVKNLTYSNEGNLVKLSWSPIETPNAIDDAYLKNYFDKNYKNWSTKFFNRRKSYNEKNIGNLQYEIFIRGNDGTLQSLGTTTSNTFTVSAPLFKNPTYVVKSTYSIFKGNASSGSEIKVKSSIIPIEPDIPDENNNGEDTDE